MIDTQLILRKICRLLLQEYSSLRRKGVEISLDDFFKHFGYDFSKYRIDPNMINVIEDTDLKDLPADLLVEQFRDFIEWSSPMKFNEYLFMMGFKPYTPPREMQELSMEETKELYYVWQAEKLGITLEAFCGLIGGKPHKDFSKGHIDIIGHAPSK